MIYTMAKEMIKGVVITPNGLGVFEIKHTFENLKMLLDIDSPVDIQSRKIGDKYYDIWLDDEGLFKAEKGHLKGTALCKDAAEILVGNILILNSNEEGETTSLSEEDIENVKAHYIEGKMSKGYSTCVGMSIVDFNGRLEYTIR